MGDGKGGGRDAHRHRHRHSHTWSPAYLEARRLYRTLQTLHIQTDTALTFCVHVCDCVFIHACVRACVCVCVYERVRMGVHIFIHAHNQSSRLACRGDRQPQPCERGAGCHLQTHSPPAQTGFTAHTSTSTHAYIHTYIPQYFHVCLPNFSSRAVTMCLLVMGWLRSVGSIKLKVSFAEYRLFYRALLQKRPIILSILLTVANPYVFVCNRIARCRFQAYHI